MVFYTMHIILLFIFVFMVGYLWKLLYAVLFAMLTIYTYYYTFSFHKESFEWYAPYIVTMLLFYGIYKTWNYFKQEKQLTFTPLKLILFFLPQLFILSTMTFSLAWSSGGLGVTLFFKILMFCLIPFIFTIFFLWVGRTILKKVSGFEEETQTFQFLSSLWLWFFLFVTFLTIVWFFWWYNFVAVWTIFLLGLIWSYKECFYFLKWLTSFSFTIDDHSYDLTQKKWYKNIHLFLLSSEFLFIVVSFLISVNFIFILRPMPIGWDDLWVYMNYPNLMASNGSLLHLGGMYAWQVFTGIWYMLHSATQAFYLNNLWGILSFLVITLTLREFLSSKFKQTFLNIPLLIGTIYLAIPMTIFQLAKDMKLDNGLLFVSSIAVYIIFYLLSKYIWYKNEYKWENFEISSSTGPESSEVEVSLKKNGTFWMFSYFTSYMYLWDNIFSKKSTYIYLALAWILSGFAFSIKITSLLLISGVIGVISYSFLGVAGFLGYIALYIAVFTKWHLWAIMNVVVPTDAHFVNMVSLISLSIAVVCYLYSFQKYRLENTKKYFQVLGVYLLAVWIWIAPWVTRNIYDTRSLSTGAILGWVWESFSADYTKIYSKDELAQLDASNSGTSMTASGTSNNEDFGRYFGYEEGINNYLKLPYNLTMQVNQRGEYMDLSYLFFAFIPLILFFSYKTWIFTFWAFFFTILPLAFFVPAINKVLSDFFSKFHLPEGYLIFALFFFVPFLFLLYTLKKDKLSQLLRLNLTFWVWYIFLWAISAFGIIWYGITMYYSIFIILALGMYGVSVYKEDDAIKVKFFKFFGSLVVFFFTIFYIFQSSFPHGFTNIKSSSYLNFKAWIQNNYISIFESQPDYFAILTELNLSASGREKLYTTLVDNIKDTELAQVLQENHVSNLHSLNTTLSQIEKIDDPKRSLEIRKLKRSASKLRTELYKNILYTPLDLQNTDGIYRIGTFLRYFITNNQKRIFDDSLVTEFEKYFYSENNLDTSLQRMKDIWVNYFLVDLNAATIDKDPRRNLTNRFEHLLKTFPSDKLELVASDSICLKIALEEYKNEPKTEESLEKFITLAWVNYESYDQDENVLSRGQKQLMCYNKILDLMENKSIDESHYAYLIPIVNYISSQKIENEEQLLGLFQQLVPAGWLVLFKILP